MFRWIVVLLLGSVSMATAGQAAESFCQESAALYCNDFDAGSWKGMEHEGDAVLVSSSQSGEQVFHGSGAVRAILDTDGVGAGFGLRFAGQEQVYVRFYLRFDSTWDRPMHHFFALHGDRPDNMWSCHGTAGCRPDGTLCLDGTTIDSREVVAGEVPGEPFFYAYFPGMSCDSAGTCQNYANPQAICDGCALRGLPCNDGLECCWGNHFNLNQSRALSLHQDRWYAVETMVKANSLTGGGGLADGEMALWVDGSLVAHHTGIRWRDVSELLLNHFVVWNYFPEADRSYRVWFDNVVIATAPIGLLDTAGIFRDAFEAGDTAAWSARSP